MTLKEFFARLLLFLLWPGLIGIGLVLVTVLMLIFWPLVWTRWFKLSYSNDRYDKSPEVKFFQHGDN